MGQPTGGMFTTLLNKTAILGTVVRVAAAAPRALLRRGGAMTRYVGLLARPGANIDSVCKTNLELMNLSLLSAVSNV